MAVTVNQVVQDALGILGEVTGIGVQTYSEPRLIKDCGRGFNTLFKKRMWRQYCQWTNAVLDGVFGKPVTDAFATVMDMDDIKTICPMGFSDSIPRLPEGLNPAIMTGTSPLYWDSLPVNDPEYMSKKFRVYPMAATGEVSVYARHHPKLTPETGVFEEWTGDDILHLDRDLLALATAHAALAGDDLNSMGTEAVRGMLDIKYMEIVKGFADHTISLGMRTAPVPRSWFEAP
jgi:hypothetical protein